MRMYLQWVGDRDRCIYWVYLENSMLGISDLSHPDFSLSLSQLVLDSRAAIDEAHDRAQSVRSGGRSAVQGPMG